MGNYLRILKINWAITPVSLNSYQTSSDLCLHRFSWYMKDSTFYREELKTKITLMHLQDFTGVFLFASLFCVTT